MTREDEVYRKQRQELQAIMKFKKEKRQVEAELAQVQQDLKKARKMYAKCLELADAVHANADATAEQRAQKSQLHSDIEFVLRNSSIFRDSLLPCMWFLSFQASFRLHFHCARR